MSNKLKRNAIKVASVGMATVMAATPMTAFAAEAEPQTNANATEGIASTPLAAPIEAVETTLASAATNVADLKLADAETTAEVTEKTEDKAGAALEDAQKQIDTMKSEDKKADDAAADNADIVSNINKGAADTDSDMTQAAGEFAGKRAAVNNASSIPAAEAAAADAVRIAEGAQKEFDEASANYNELVKKIETNNEVIKTAQANYDKALADCSDDLEAAASELAAAKKVSDDLNAAAQAEAQRLANTGAATIVAAQDAVDKASDSEVWGKRDEAFYAIIRYYYVPEVLKGTVTSDKLVFTRPREAQCGPMVEGGKEQANYVEVIYTDKDGNENQKLYLNYKVEGGKLLIFAKEEKDIPYYNTENGRHFLSSEDVANATKVGNDQYILLNDGKVSTLVIAGEVKNGKTTVTTSIANQSDAVYSLDKDGNVVATVTGDVTTVTKTEKSLAGSTTKYDSEEEAEKAGKDAIKLENGETLVEDSVDVETSSETTYTYDVQYKAVFTATINVSGMSKDYYTEGAFKDSCEEAARKIIEDAGYKVVGSSRNIDVSTEGIYEKVWKVNVWRGWKQTAKAGSTVSVTFAIAGDSHTETVNVGFLKNLGYDISQIFGDPSEAKAKEIAGAYTDAVAGASIEGFNWNAKTVRLRYTEVKAESADAVTVTDKNQAANAAQASAQNAVAKEVQQVLAYLQSRNSRVSGVAGSVWGGTSKAKNENSKTTYTYDKVDYATQTSTTKNEVVSTTTYEAAKVEHEVGPYDNANYNAYVKDPSNNADKILLFEKTDVDFNKFINDHKAEVAKQATIMQQAEAASKAYADAQGRVADLQKKLAEIDRNSKNASATEIAKRAELEVELDQAKKDMNNAEATLKSITGQLSGLATDLANRITALTPVVPAITVVSGAQVAAQTVTPAPAANLVAVNPVAAPLAQVTLDDAAEDEDVQLEQLVEADDVDAALADMTLEDQTKANTIIGWWWLLLIAILGGTGYTLYRKAQAKKATKKLDEK